MMAMLVVGSRDHSSLTNIRQRLPLEVLAGGGLAVCLSDRSRNDHAFNRLL